MGVPQGQEQSISARIETSDGDVILLREATLSALVQAYMDVFTHPTTNALELKAAALPSSETGPMSYQLVPGTTSEEELRRELATAPQRSFLDDGSDETEVRWNSLQHGFQEGIHDREGSSRGLSTRTMEEVDMSVTRSKIGWQTRDDGPIFGETPTHHSSPNQAARNREADDPDADSKTPSDELD